MNFVYKKGHYGAKPDQSLTVAQWLQFGFYIKVFRSLDCLKLIEHLTYYQIRILFSCKIPLIEMFIFIVAAQLYLWWVLICHLQNYYNVTIVGLQKQRLWKTWIIIHEKIQIIQSLSSIFYKDTSCLMWNELLFLKQGKKRHCLNYR